MTIAEQLRRVREDLAEWARRNGGEARVASDQVQVLDFLMATKPGGFMCAVLFESEEPRGEHSELGRCDRGFKVVVSRGKGFRADSGAALTEGSGGGPSVFDLVEGAREVVRGLRLPEEAEGEQQAGYRGSGPFQVEGFVLDAYEVRFGLGAQLPEQLA